MKLEENIQRIREMMGLQVDESLKLIESTTNIGGPFKTDLENGPANHGSRAFGNWQSDNAWDVFAEPGSVVNSYTQGTVAKIRATNKKSGKVFGTQVTVKGNGKYPDIFYTHLKNVKLKVGDKVNVGDYVGEVTEWCTTESCSKMLDGTHVHIGLPRGNHLRDLLKNSDKIFSGEKTSSNDSDSENEIDSTQFVDKLKKLEDSTKKFENQKPKGVPIPYDAEVEVIQSALQILGFSLPRWGVDGKFGNETERAVLNFQKQYNLDKTGILDENQFSKLVKSSMEAINKDESLLSKIQTTKTETLPDDKIGKPNQNQVVSTSDSEYAIIKPKNYDGKNVHVLFGGAHTSGYSPNSSKPQNIQKYVSVLSPYANDVIIVVTHHMNSLNNVRKYVKDKFGGKVTSIAGFSQGGRETWNHAGDSSLNLVGLIDPSTYEINIKFGSNTYLYCDPKNWGTSGFYGQTRKRLEWYCSNKEKYGSQVICFNQGGTHMNFQILKSFYNKFGSKL